MLSCDIITCLPFQFVPTQPIPPPLLVSSHSLLRLYPQPQFLTPDTHLFPDPSSLSIIPCACKVYLWSKSVVSAEKGRVVSQCWGGQRRVVVVLCKGETRAYAKIETLSSLFLSLSQSLPLSFSLLSLSLSLSPPSYSIIVCVHCCWFMIFVCIVVCFVCLSWGT